MGHKAYRAFAVFAYCLLILALLGLGSAFAGNDSKPRFILKVGTLAPRGIGWARQVEEVLDPAVRKSSNGDVRMKVYWGGIMGDDPAILEKMRQGILQVGGLTAVGTRIACPDFSVVQLPYLFRNWEEVDYLRQAMFSTFARLMKKNGYILFLWVDQDFDQVYSVSRGLDSPESFRGETVATWFGPLEERLITILGAKPVPCTIPQIGETVRSGKADAVIAPAIWMVGTQLYAKVRFVNPMKIRYSPATIVVERSVWESLPQQYRRNALAMREDLTKRFIDGTRKEGEKALEAMVQYGVRPVKIEPGVAARLRAKAMPVWRDMVGVVYPLKLLNEVQARLEEFRNHERR